MKRIVRLTESDLVKLVKRVISEQTQASVKGPEMSFKEASTLAKLINSSGTQYIKEENVGGKPQFVWLKPWKLTFRNSKIGSEMKFSRNPAEGELSVVYQPGDMLNVVPSDMALFTKYNLIITQLRTMKCTYSYGQNAKTQSGAETPDQCKNGIIDMNQVIGFV
jgi:hypothetical protein